MMRAHTYIRIYNRICTHARADSRRPRPGAVSCSVGAGRNSGHCGSLPSTRHLRSVVRGKECVGELARARERRRERPGHSMHQLSPMSFPLRGSVVYVPAPRPLPPHATHTRHRAAHARPQACRTALLGFRKRVSGGAPPPQGSRRGLRVDDVRVEGFAVRQGGWKREWMVFRGMPPTVPEDSVRGELRAELALHSDVVAADAAPLSIIASSQSIAIPVRSTILCSALLCSALLCTALHCSPRWGGHFFASKSRQSRSCIRGPGNKEQWSIPRHKP